jgi:hypothetical protein
MIKFAGYTVRNHQGDFVPHLFIRRQLAIDFCTQNSIHSDNIVQLLWNQPVAYVEPKDDLINLDND